MSFAGIVEIKNLKYIKEVNAALVQGWELVSIVPCDAPEWVNYTIGRRAAPQPAKAGTLATIAADELKPLLATVMRARQAWHSAIDETGMADLADNELRRLSALAAAAERAYADECSALLEALHFKVADAEDRAALAAEPVA